MNEEMPKQPEGEVKKPDQLVPPEAGLPIDKFFAEKQQIIQRQRQREKENNGPRKPEEQRGDTGAF